MYTRLQELLEIGLNKSQIARHLGISRPTLYEYLNLTPDEFEERLNGMQIRKKKADVYKDLILSWLREFPDLSAAQIYDRLQEKYKSEINFAESTLRKYVHDLRKEHNIPKSMNPRQYQAVSDPPMGKQMQVDFGEKRVLNSNNDEIKLYVMCFVLAHSRHKYYQWQDRPFTTTDIIKIHEDAFEYYGGLPEEIVYDQDHLILVSENHGELIYTHDFSAYLKNRKYRVHMCRKGDPESKGKIENVVGYVKNNFAHNRVFYNLERWNEDCLAWLKRRANSKIHGTTKKIPAQVFDEERKYLRPILEKIKTKSPTLSITYRVRKDNTVLIKGNRYSVPLGTYKGPETNVKVVKTGNNQYIILALETDIELARHDIPGDKGNLIQNNDHKRNKSKKIPGLMKEIISSFQEQEKVCSFLNLIKEDKPRYIRDQLLLIQSSLTNSSQETINKALDFCLKNKLYSAVDFRDAVNHYGKVVTTEAKPLEIDVVPLSPSSIDKIKAKPQVRDIAEYSKIFNE
ncbi:IS21 family transposase [Halocella sp. SP3-1]|nr:IS21 family transposase [Halocella sp. SP3-1]